MWLFIRSKKKTPVLHRNVFLFHIFKGRKADKQDNAGKRTSLLTEIFIQKVLLSTYYVPEAPDVGCMIVSKLDVIPEFPGLI